MLVRNKSIHNKKSSSMCSYNRRRLYINLPVDNKCSNIYKFIYFKKMPIRFYTATGADTQGMWAAGPSQPLTDSGGGGSPPLRFQNSFSMALKGKKIQCKIGKTSILKKLLFLNLDFLFRNSAGTPPPHLNLESAPKQLLIVITVFPSKNESLI